MGVVTAFIGVGAIGTARILEIDQTVAIIIHFVGALWGAVTVDVRVLGTAPAE